MFNKDLADIEGLKVCTDKTAWDKPVKGVYVGDLLSRVMSGAKQGDVWITIHTHMNVIAVAALNDLSAVIIAEGVPVPDNIIRKAQEEDVMIVSTPWSAYRVCIALSKRLEMT